MCGGIFRSALSASCAMLFFCNLSGAVEIIAQKSDTFIFEAIASGEFSKSDFIATAHVKGEQAIAYLPFELKTEELGVQAQCDAITDCSLVLFIKSLPLLPDSNSATSADITSPPSKRELKLEESQGLDEKIGTKAEVAIEYAEEKIDEESKSKVVIEVFGITDRESFEPNSRDFRVSWDGKHDAAAPKHNTMDNQLEETGLFYLGKIEIDVEDDEYENGDRYEFSTPELKDFLRFALGITSAHNEAPPFRTPLRKIENAAIVLRQKSGPSGVFFFSADSMGDEVGKEQSGDEVEKYFNSRKRTDASGHTIEQDESAAAANKETQLKESLKESFRESENAAIAARKADSEGESNLEGAILSSSDEGKANTERTANGEKKSSSAKGKPDQIAKNSGEDDEEIEYVRDIKPDRRPRINFEFRRESESERTENIAPTDAVQSENLKDK